MADPIQIIRSRDRLKRVRGGRDGLYPFLELNTWDIVHYLDDFLGDEIRGSTANASLYELNTGVDATFTILADQANGVAQLSASTGAGASGEYGGISLPELAFTGDRNAVIAVRLSIDAVTSVKVEIGFIDDVTDNGAVDTLSTPSVNSADAAVWVIDTDDTDNWQAFGTADSVIATKIEPGFPPVAGTFETMIVALRDSNARFYRLNADGEMTFDSDWMTGAITATDQVSPWMFVQLRGAVDRNINIDFLDVRARRTIN